MNAFKNVSYLWFLNAEVTDISKNSHKPNMHERLQPNHEMTLPILLKLIVINHKLTVIKNTYYWLFEIKLF